MGFPEFHVVKEVGQRKRYPFPILPGQAFSHFEHSYWLQTPPPKVRLSLKGELAISAGNSSLRAGKSEGIGFKLGTRSSAG